MLGTVRPFQCLLANFVKLRQVYLHGGFSAEVGAKRKPPCGVAVEGVMPSLPSLPRNPPISPRWTGGGTFLSRAFSPLYIVELKLSLRTRLARQTHARCTPNP